ncbi:elongation factor 1-beta [Halobacteriales archaeon QS_8_69_26]|nr:MAG: elongation factor 1-beta [Halobacteriales archaeon QS_8_69_26]
MGKVAAEIKVMPTGDDVDLDDLQERVEASIPEGAKVNNVERQDVAFGLVALVATVVVPDDAGGTDAVEEAFADLEGVQRVSVEGVTRI